MLAPHKPTSAAIEGQTHSVECPECLGSGRYVVEFDGGQEQRDRGPCSDCDGAGKIVREVSPEDCACEACLSGYWFWPAPIGELPARRFELFTHALRAGNGEITKRDRSGAHWRVTMVPA